MLDDNSAAQETSQKFLSFVSLLLFLCIPSFALFYEHFGFVGIAGYVVAVSVALLLLLRFKSTIDHLIAKRYMLFVGLFVVGLIAVFALFYPLETAGKIGIGSDRDEALNIAATRLLAGEYPYYGRTPLGGPLTPLPGSILLSMPFVLLGNSAYQNLLWVLIFLYVTGIYLKDKVSALVLLVTAFALSPAVQYEFISGGDLLANSLYIIVFLFLTIKIFATPESPMWMKVAISALLGVGLASRVNFFILMPLLFVLLMRIANFKLAIVCVATICFSASLIILPFYLFDPPAFAPFTAGNKLNTFDEMIPFISYGVTLATAILAVILAVVLIRRPDSELLPAFFWMSAIIQLFPILCSIVLYFMKYDQLVFGFLRDRYGLIFLFFGLWGCWPYFYRRQGIADDLPFRESKTLSAQI